MKKKFEEFAKEKGIIIVGYSGCDESVMGPLNELASDQNNYKNGIFWCIRDGDSVSSAVVDFINRQDERIFFVKIDGFDELLCDMNYYLLNGESPTGNIHFSGLEYKISTAIQNNSAYQTSASERLKRQARTILSEVKLRKNDNDVSDKIIDAEVQDDISYVTSNRKYRQKYSYIEELLEKRSFNEALTAIKNETKNEKDEDNLTQLMELQAFTYFQINQDEDALKILIALIDRNPYEFDNYINASICVESYAEKLKFIDRALVLDDSNTKLLSRKADILEAYNNSKIEYTINIPDQEIILTLEKGENIAKSVSNRCWMQLFDYLLHFAKYTNEFSKCEALVAYYLERKPHDFRTISRKALLMREYHHSSYEDIIRFVQTNQSTNPKHKFSFDYLKTQIADEFHETKEIILFCKTQYRNTNAVLLSKADFIASSLRSLQRAIECLSKSLESQFNERLAKHLVSLYITSHQFDKANQLLENYHIPENEFEDDILDESCEWIKVEEKCIEKLKKIPNDQGTILRLTHAQLQQHKFNEAFELLNQELTKINFSNEFLLINYFLAKWGKTTKKKNDERIMQLSRCAFNPRVKIAALLMTGRKQEALAELKNEIEKNYSDLYEIKGMYIFQKYLGDDDYQMLEQSLFPLPVITDMEWAEIANTFVDE